MSDNFSITDPQKNRGSNSTGIFKEEITIFFCLIPLVVIYAVTYFDRLIVSNSDGDTIYFVFSGLWLAGSGIGYNIIKIFQKLQNRQLYEEQESLDDNDGEIGIESGLLETYQYSSSRDLQWGTLLIAGAIGGLNVVIYVIFLTFIN